MNSSKIRLLIFVILLFVISLICFLGNNEAFHKKDVVIELESAILNLMANYRMYFKKEKCNVKVYFYYTDLTFTTQEMSVLNKYYRTY